MGVNLSLYTILLCREGSFPPQRQLSLHLWQTRRSYSSASGHLLLLLPCTSESPCRPCLTLACFRLNNVRIHTAVQ